MTEAIDQIRRLLKKTKPKKKAPSHLLSSGSTLLNLACSDDPRGAYRKGHYYYLVGDSQSGKTWLAMSVFAEASINPRYPDELPALERGLEPGEGVNLRPRGPREAPLPGARGEHPLLVSHAVRHPREAERRDHVERALEVEPTDAELQGWEV